MSIAGPKFCLAGVAALLFTAASVQAEETRNAALDASLRRLDVTLVGSVTIELGAEAGYVLSAEDGEALDAVEIKTTGNRLIVKQRGKKGGWFWNDHDRPAVDLTVTLPAVEAIDLAGAGRLVGAGFEGAELEVSLAGAGECELTELRLDRLEIDLAGAARCETQGTARIQEISIAGAGSYEGFDLESEEATVSVAGAGAAEVTVTERLEGSVAGIGNISYRGSPKQITQSVSGLGSVEAD
jgi:hypothetical protein